MYHLIARQVTEALNEDLANSIDWTASLINPNKTITASIKTRNNMLLYGKMWVEQAFKLINSNIQVNWLVDEGAWISAGTKLCTIEGNAQSILTSERTALNFLQTLSATATITHQFVELVKDTQVKIMDTRKTIPGLRIAQKAAVVSAGGTNQRIGLFDGVLIKENHIAAHGGIAPVLRYAYQHIPKHIPIQIEVENFKQLVEAIDNDAKLILLDNMSVDQVQEAVNYCKNQNIELEASGNIDLTNVRAYALTGIHRISIGSLTKNIQAIDLSLRFD